MRRLFIKPLSCLILALFITNCGADFTFFFSSGFDDTVGGGIVIVIHVDDDDDVDIEDFVLVSGHIPLGMELTVDGTLEGTPEETGFFGFVVDWQFADGHTERESFNVEIRDE